MTCSIDCVSYYSPQTLYNHIVADIKRMNAKHKNNKAQSDQGKLFPYAIVEIVVP